ncbi:hypothetical protein M33023_02470 [Candidatus Phytoplasma asteris]|uniref:Uncharacterized protein n=1 Tax=Candidatus Phytoplasma asteris TaxID=85620 RepID=A0ABZ2YEU7_9MOLU
MLILSLTTSLSDYWTHLANSTLISRSNNSCTTRLASVSLSQYALILILLILKIKINQLKIANIKRLMTYY